MDTVIEVLRSNRAYYCLECGKCTSVCPVAWHEPGFSPRRMVENAVLAGDGQAAMGDDLWSCLTCDRCTQVCPSDVRFLGFVRDLRTVAHNIGRQGQCSHGDAIMSWMRLMTDPALKQDRLGWLTDDLRISQDSDTLLFIGCLPYFQVLFGKSGAETIEIAHAAVRALNILGIEPIVLADERCCGHDLIWEGEIDTFHQLASINTKLIASSGAERIVTACPECARTLKLDYHLEQEVIHISELLAQVEFPFKDIQKPVRTKVTFHDPCRLGRHLGIYQAPRQVIAQLGIDLVEMSQSGNRSLCCGTSAWTNCGATSKSIQVERLRQARETGAETLVTACAKCQIHFLCALEDPELSDELAIEMVDLVTLVTGAMELMAEAPPTPEHEIDTNRNGGIG